MRYLNLDKRYERGEKVSLKKGRKKPTTYIKSSTRVLSPKQNRGHYHSREPATLKGFYEFSLVQRL